MNKKAAERPLTVNAAHDLVRLLVPWCGIEFRCPHSSLLRGTLAACAAQRKEWRLLFSSHRDGKSFNTFFGRVSATPGPTLLLIREKAPGGNSSGAEGAGEGSTGSGNGGGKDGGGSGRLFGGYAPQPWAKSGTFYGDVSSFIFRLEPTVEVGCHRRARVTVPVPCLQEDTSRRTRAG